VYDGVKSLFDALPLLNIDLDVEMGVVFRGWFGIAATESNPITLSTKLGSDCRAYVSTCAEDKCNEFRRHRLFNERYARNE